MKKFGRIILVVIAVLVALFFILKSWTKSNSPEAATEITSGDLTVNVEYCQPAVKNRVIFGELVPYNVVWRTGANEATIINFSRDVNIAGQSLAAGKYTLWTIPTPDDWTIIINKQTGQWGTSYDESDDVLRVKVPSFQKSNVTELFTITMEQGSKEEILMNLNWDKTSVQVPIK